MQVSFHLNGRADGLRLLPPLRFGERHGLGDEGGQIDGGKLLVLIERPIEFAEAGHDVGRILGGSSQELEKLERLHFVVQQTCFLDEQIAKTKNGCKRVVKVMRDAARHLPEGAETFLLNYLLLRRLEFAQRLLEFLIRLAQVVLGLTAEGEIFH